MHAHYVHTKAKNCVGAKVDPYVPWQSGKAPAKLSVDDCKRKCADLGNQCSGFQIILSGSNANTCQFKRGAITIDEADYLWDDRDCYEKGTH